MIADRIFRVQSASGFLTWERIFRAGPSFSPSVSNRCSSDRRGSVSPSIMWSLNVCRVKSHDSISTTVTRWKTKQEDKEGCENWPERILNMWGYCWWSCKHHSLSTSLCLQTPHHRLERDWVDLEKWATCITCWCCDMHLKSLFGYLNVRQTHLVERNHFQGLGTCKACLWALLQWRDTWISPGRLNTGWICLYHLCCCWPHLSSHLGCSRRPCAVPAPPLCSSSCFLWQPRSLFSLDDVSCCWCTPPPCPPLPPPLSPPLMWLPSSPLHFYLPSGPSDWSRGSPHSCARSASFRPCVPSLCAACWWAGMGWLTLVCCWSEVRPGWDGGRRRRGRQAYADDLWTPWGWKGRPWDFQFPWVLSGGRSPAPSDAGWHSSPFWAEAQINFRQTLWDSVVSHLLLNWTGSDKARSVSDLFFFLWNVMQTRWNVCTHYLAMFCLWISSCLRATVSMGSEGRKP